MDDCLLCRVADADAEFERVRVWEDMLWRLSVVGRGPIAGFAHLEPVRHVPFITDLDGPEAATLPHAAHRAAAQAIADELRSNQSIGWVSGGTDDDSDMGPAAA